MTSDASAPTANEPKTGDTVTIGGRNATFLYRRDGAAFVRFAGETDTRVVPFSKLQRAA